MQKMTRNVSLRLWTPQGAEVAFVRQVAPEIEDLTERAVAVNPLTDDYPKRIAAESGAGASQAEAPLARLRNETAPSGIS